MSEVAYTAGSWLAMAGRHTWLLVEMTPDPALIARCWSLVQEDAEVDRILGMVLDEGFRTVRSFALVHRTADTWRCCLRGDAVVTAADVSPVTAAGVATWVDRELGRVDGVALAAGEPPTNGLEYPLVSGVALAATMRIGTVSLRQDPAHAPAAAPVRPDPPHEAPQHEERSQPEERPAEVVSVQRGPTQVADSVNRYFGSAGPVSAVPDVEYFTELPEQATPAEPCPATVPPAEVSVVVPDPPRPGYIERIDWAAQANAWDPAIRRPVRHSPGPASDDNVDETVLRPSQTDVRQTSGPDIVSAVRCLDGHLSPVGADTCRVCAAPVPDQQPTVVPRPVSGVLRLSSGDEITLDRDVLLGRRPEQQEDGRQRAHLVRLNSPDKYISRNHVEIRLDGWDVLVVDLGSKNGTTLHHADGRSETLTAHAPFVLGAGVRVVLDPNTQTYFTFEVRA